MPVSVVMSVYNGAHHLAETLESILGQEGVEFDLVVVDDGSTDTTRGILAEYAARDRRVRVLEQENRGLTRSLIRACAETTSPFIARHDAGDRSRAGRLARQAAALEADPTLAFVSSQTAYFGPRWEYLYLETGTGRAASPTRILSDDDPKGVIDGPTSHPSVMFRRAVYERAGGYRDAFRMGQDWDLWYRLAALGTFQLLAEPLYDVRVEPAGVSMLNRDAQRVMGRLALEAHRMRSAGGDDDSVLEQARAVRQIRLDPKSRARNLADGNYFLGEVLRRNRDPRCRAYLLEAIRTDPMMAKAWLRLVQSVFA